MATGEQQLQLRIVLLGKDDTLGQLTQLKQGVKELAQTEAASYQDAKAALQQKNLALKQAQVLLQQARIAESEARAAATKQSAEAKAQSLAEATAAKAAAQEKVAAAKADVEAAKQALLVKKAETEAVKAQAVAAKTASEQAVAAQKAETEASKQALNAEKQKALQQQQDIRATNQAQKELNDRIKAEKAALTGMNAPIGSMARLRAETAQLRQQMNLLDTSTAVGAEQLKVLQREVNANVIKIRDFDRSISGNNTLVGEYTRGIKGTVSQLKGLALTYLSVYGAVQIVGAIVRSNVQISDSLTEVQRVAGLTTQQVDKLFNTLKQIQTRTSLGDLLNLAKIGGQLGVAKDDLAGFTKALNDLTTALGGEIQGGPEDIATRLGKVINLLNLNKKFGIEAAMEKTGSAILAVGQAGIATGDYLSQFAASLGGAAARANIGIPVILGYGGALQETGVEANVAATTFTNLFTKMATDTKKFFNVAKLADPTLTLKKFTDYINTDGAKALSLFFNGLRAGGDKMTDFAQITKSLGLPGRRATQVLLALAGAQEEIAKDTKVAADAFDKGTLAAEQNDLKNQNLAGSVKKLGDALTNLVTDPDSDIGIWVKGWVQDLTFGIRALTNMSDIIKRLHTYLNGLGDDIQNTIREDISIPFEFIKGFVGAGGGGGDTTLGFATPFTGFAAGEKAVADYKKRFAEALQVQKDGDKKSADEQKKQDELFKNSLFERANEIQAQEKKVAEAKAQFQAAAFQDKIVSGQNPNTVIPENQNVSNATHKLYEYMIAQEQKLTDLKKKAAEIDQTAADKKAVATKKQLDDLKDSLTKGKAAPKAPQYPLNDKEHFQQFLDDYFKKITDASKKALKEVGGETALQMYEETTNTVQPFSQQKQQDLQAYAANVAEVREQLEKAKDVLVLADKQIDRMAQTMGLATSDQLFQFNEKLKGLVDTVGTIDKVFGTLQTTIEPIAEDIVTALGNVATGSLDRQLTEAQNRVQELQLDAQRATGAKKQELESDLKNEQAYQAKLQAERDKANQKYLKEQKILSLAELAIKTAEAIGKINIAAEVAEAAALPQLAVPIVGEASYAATVAVAETQRIKSIVFTLATAAAQAAVIASKKYAAGGPVIGPSHDAGGVKFFNRSSHNIEEMEGGEFVTKRSAVKNNMHTLETINKWGDKIRFTVVPKYAAGGLTAPLPLPRLPLPASGQNTVDMTGTILQAIAAINARIDRLQVVNNAQDTVKVNNRQQQIKSVQNF